MGMIYRIMAEVTLVLHFLWIVFVVVGVIWGRRHLPIAVVHIGGLGFAVFLQVMGWYCPLTYLEVWLRRKQLPGAGYEGSFIAHYLEKVIYPDVSMRLIFILTLLLCMLNAFVYGSRFVKRRSSDS
jgi:hypothetical protein